MKQISKMTDLQESPELKRIKTFAEYSVNSLDNLNFDCLVAIFQYLSIHDLLLLRYQCRSLNDAVCQHLQTSYRKFQLYLDADRSEDDMKRVMDIYNRFEYPDSRQRPEFRPITFNDTVEREPYLFANQSHFRAEDLIQVSSPEGLSNRKVDSLVLFLTAHMPNLTELALVINHEEHFRSVARLLSPLRKLKVFFIDLTYSPPSSRDYPEKEIVEAISGLPELESLYYFRSWAAEKFFYPEGFEGVLTHRLGNEDNLLEIILPRLRVLHCHYFAFPVGKTLDKLEELSVGHIMNESFPKNYFPAVRTLILESQTFHCYQLDNGHYSFVNVKVLKLRRMSFFVEDTAIRALDGLPNLEELHCECVEYDIHRIPGEIVERNRKIVRLYTQIHPEVPYDLQVFFREKLLPLPDLTNIITPEMMADYAAMCKVYFPELRLHTNQYPPRVQRF